MDNTIIDELLNKIKSLEAFNLELKCKIAEVESELKSSVSEKENEMSEVNLEDEMVVDDDNNMVDTNKIKMMENREKILNNLVELNITFVPFEQFNALWVMGDFTNWEPKQMIKNKDIFTFPVVLIKGFKYYFTFTARNEEGIIDFNQDHEINPRNGQAANFVDLKLTENSISSLFNFQEHMNILHEARINYSKARMENQKEVVLLENLVDFTKKFVIRHQYLSSRKDNISEKINNYYDEKIKNIKNSQTSNFNTLAEVFKGRVVEKDGNLHLISSIDLNENCIKCIRIYDKNGMKVNTDYYIKKGYLMPFKFSELDQNFRIFSHGESEKILRDHLNSPNVVKVLYKFVTGDNIQNEGMVFYKTYGNKLKVVQLLPENLDLNDYDIDTTANMINDVKSKANNLKVIFTTEEVKDPLDSLPVSIQIYYAFYKKTINVIHIHSLDEKIKIDKSYKVYCLDKKDELNEYRNFSPETTRMKIIFKKYRLSNIFYFDETQNKVIELKGQEFNLKLERIIKIECIGYLNHQLAKIKNIPIYLIAITKNEETETSPDNFILHNDKVDICTLNSTLSGYVDLSVIFDQDKKYLDFPINVALPACKICFLSVAEEMEIEKLYLDENKKRKSDEMIAFENMSNDLSTNFEKYIMNQDLILSLSKEDLQKSINTLEQYSAILPKISNYIEQNELWTFLEKIIILDSTISSLIPVFREQVLK